MNPQFEPRGMFNFRVLSVLGIVLFLIVLVAYFFYGLQPVSSQGGVSGGSVRTPGEVKQIRIVKGEGFKEIGAELSRDTLIKSISIFKMYSIITGKAQKFQPGLYEVTPAMSVPQIVDLLTSGGKNEATVTIAEGMTLKDISSALVGAGVLGKEGISEFPFKTKAFTDSYPYLANADSLEGFLFPDTYRFNLNSSVEEVLKIFLDNFNTKAWPLLQNNKNWYDMLKLASILEREVPNFDDRQVVAGILLKRLNLGIPLQVDATVSYAKCNGEFKTCASAQITRSDLQIISPYNTYKRLGLPPTPISNPGQIAIKAAGSPQKTAYLYYLSVAKTGETLFSKTLDEHNAKRAKYL